MLNFIRRLFGMTQSMMVPKLAESAHSGLSREIALVFLKGLLMQRGRCGIVRSYEDQYMILIPAWWCIEHRTDGGMDVFAGNDFLFGSRSTVEGTWYIVT